MYRVRRDKDRVEVIQNGEVVYSGLADEYIVFKESTDATKLTCKKVLELTDAQILVALMTCVHVPSMVRSDPPAGEWKP